jgi:predicted P-loop ATPase
MAEYQAMNKQEKIDVKSIGYYVGGFLREGKRTSKHLSYRDMICLDADKIGGVDPSLRLRQALNNTEAFIHPTHSNHPGSAHLRIILPLKSSVSPEQYQFISRIIADRINFDWFDSASYSVAQPMFWPSIPRDAEYKCTEFHGDWLDPEEIFEKYPNWRDISTWPGADKTEISLLGAKPEDPRNKKGVIGAFCRVYTVSDIIQTIIPDVYRHEGGNRYSYAAGSTVKGAIIYDEDLFLYSHHSTDPAHGRSVNAFDLFRIHKFGHLDAESLPGTPTNKLPSYAAATEAATEIEPVKIEIVKSRQKELEEDFSGLTDPTPEDWRASLRITSKGDIMPTFLNAQIIIANDPEYTKAMAYNEFSGNIIQMRDLSNIKPDGFQNEWKSVCDHYIRGDIEKRYQVAFSERNIKTAIEQVADQNKFHPVQDYLNKLEWDGVPRIESFFSRFVGAPVNSYTKSVSKLLFLAGVARIMNPGCKYDYVIILEGPQGIRKSTLWRTLAGDQWFSELETFETKVAGEIIRGTWLVELPELSAFGKSEAEAIKAFITMQADRYRDPYAPRATSKPRSNIFVGSTNLLDNYLKDNTGNRRFLPIRCNTRVIDTEAIAAERDQLWAEATVQYMLGDHLYLQGEAQTIAESEQQLREVDDEWAGEIEEWLSSPARADRFQKSAGIDFSKGVESQMEDRSCTCVREIWEDCIGSRQPIRAFERNRIRSIMKKMEGWETSRKKIKFGTRFGTQAAYIKTGAPF